MQLSGQRGSWLVDAFETLGVNTQALSKQFPGETATLLRYPDTIPPDDLNTLLIECAHLTGNQHFGLHLVVQVPISSLGVYGYLLMNAGTVAQFLTLARHYYAAFYRGAQVDIIRHRSTWELVYRRIEVPAIKQQHDTEWTLGFFVQMICSKLGENWAPDSANFQESAPPDLTELKRVFGPTIRFNQPVNSIHINLRHLDNPFNDADSQLLEVVRDQADALMKEHTGSASIESHVRMLMMKDIELGPPNAESTAHQLGMSLATLKRRLAVRNLGFRALRDGVVIDLAKRALAETDLSVSYVAMQLGYSEASAFNHTFMRLVGCNPRSYRERARQRLC
ncbi:MAG: AraC family transcriptional regulator [Halieaceae bacterium]|jgi:AraC-like DNA-binding protein|nr:AraC family transcriptional regulator [Halieaceae bacterium]